MAVAPATAATPHRDHTRRLFGVVWAILLVFPLIAPNDYIVSLGAFFFINLILIASLNLVMGYCGQISLCHGAFFGLGAYASGVLAAKFDVSPWLGIIAAMGLASFSALIIGLPALRLKGHYLAMATLGFNAIMSVLFNELVSLTGGPNGLTGVPPFSVGGFDIANDTRFFYLAWAFAGVIMLLIYNLINSRVGRGMRTLATSEIAAASLGIDTFRYKLKIFVVSATMAGLAGAMYVHFINFASPETFNFFTSVFLVVMVALGGWGSYWGPLFGALIYTAVPELLRAFKDLEIFVFGLSMVLVLLFFPDGVAGAIKALKARMSRSRSGKPAEAGS